MKFAAILLAFFITALSVLPCDVCNEISKTNECQKEAKHVDDCSLCCSPFHTCGTCAGFVLPTSLSVTATKEFSPSQVIDFYQVTKFLDHFGAIWQPPKIA